MNGVERSRRGKKRGWGYISGFQVYWSWIEMYQLNLEIGAIFDLEESSLMGEVGVDTRLQQVEEWRKNDRDSGCY